MQHFFCCSSSRRSFALWISGGEQFNTFNRATSLFILTLNNTLEMNTAKRKKERFFIFKLSRAHCTHQTMAVWALRKNYIIKLCKLVFLHSFPLIAPHSSSPIVSHTSKDKTFDLSSSSNTQNVYIHFGNGIGWEYIFSAVAYKWRWDFDEKWRKYTHNQASGDAGEIWNFF